MCHYLQARPLLNRAIETRDFSELVDERLNMQFVESEMCRMIEAAAACVRHSAPRRPRMIQVILKLETAYFVEQKLYFKFLTQSLNCVTFDVDN